MIPILLGPTNGDDETRFMRAAQAAALCGNPRSVLRPTN